MRVIALLSVLFFSTAVLSFDVQQAKFSAPQPLVLCNSSEEMFGGASVIYETCSDGIDSIVTTGIESQRGFDELEQFISNYQPDGSYTDYDITDALFDGTIVAITPFDSKMKVASNGAALRFCLNDRTVYLVKNDSGWQVITVLQN